MKTNTFKHLQSLCAGKGIVCERTRGKVELTTPDGGTTAECDTVSDAFDTLRGDSTFADLPIQVRTKPVQSSEQYAYKFSDRVGIFAHTEAETLNEALTRMGWNCTVTQEGRNCAALERTTEAGKRVSCMVTWKPVQNDTVTISRAEHAALVAVAQAAELVRPASTFAPLDYTNLDPRWREFHVAVTNTLANLATVRNGGAK